MEGLCLEETARVLIEESVLQHSLPRHSALKRTPSVERDKERKVMHCGTRFPRHTSNLRCGTRELTQGIYLHFALWHKDSKAYTSRGVVAQEFRGIYLHFALWHKETEAYLRLI